LAAGNTEAATGIYSEILAEDKANVPALAGLARAYVAANQIEKAKQILTQVPEARRNDAVVAAARAALDVAEQASSVGPIGELEQKVAANSLDHQARFDLAVALNANGKRPEAVEQLMAIVKRDRKWNDDGARKQLVQFFEAWGPTDEATVAGRKKLSSVLFS
jgi:putative thioredoxin